MPSWMPEEKTARNYQIKDGSVWRIHNEFQQISCPHCDQNQYCRATHIWYLDSDGMPLGQEFYNNYNTDLEHLQMLPITYLTDEDEKDGIGVSEEHREGEWMLVRDAKIIGEEVEEL